MPSIINNVCVCGAGTMGAGIAEVFASGGYQTILYDVNDEVLHSAENRIRENLKRLVAKNKIPSLEEDAILERLVFTTTMGAWNADLIIEAIVEDLQPKISLLNQLAELNPATILASNTSSLSLTQIATALKNPGQLAGLHFFNPAPMMKLVEIIWTDYTSKEVLKVLEALISRLGKTPVTCRDAPGFVVNRVARPFYIESLRIAEEGHLAFDEIDSLLESRGFKMGPFKLMDLIGNDINYAVSNSLYNQLNKPERLKPSFLQEEKVKSGDLGKKTGKGYFTY